MMRIASLLLSCVVAWGCGATTGATGNSACQKAPQGTECQSCLKAARVTCVDRGTCATPYATWESCSVRSATNGCVDSLGNPATNCCAAELQTFSDCLDANCAEWNACLR